MPQRISVHQNKRMGEKGFSLTESLVALTVGTMIIAGSGFAMRSTQSLIQGSGEKANQRQNTTNGLRLLRSEVERSLYIMFNGQLPNEEMANTDLGQLDNGSQHLLQYCRILAAKQNSNLSLHPDLPQGGVMQQSRDGMTINVNFDAHPAMTSPDSQGRDLNSKFIPIFALQMDDVEHPVVYGLTAGGNNRTFALSRCGTPLRMDGTYDDGKTPFISSILDGIGMIPCTEQEQNNEGECLSQIPDSESSSGFKSALAVTAEDILDLLHKEIDYGYGIQLDNNQSPSRIFLEPAFRIETDDFRKLVRFTSPMDCKDEYTDCPTNSFTEILSASRSLSNQPLLMTAFARADKNITAGRKKQGSDDSVWFRNVSSKRVRFLVDGSGSMSACMIWSKNADGKYVKGDSYRYFYSPEEGQYIRTKYLPKNTHGASARSAQDCFKYCLTMRRLRSNPSAHLEPAGATRIKNGTNLPAVLLNLVILTATPGNLPMHLLTALMMGIPKIGVEPNHGKGWRMPSVMRKQIHSISFQMVAQLTVWTLEMANMHVLQTSLYRQGSTLQT